MKRQILKSDFLCMMEHNNGNKDNYAADGSLYLPKLEESDTQASSGHVLRVNPVQLSDGREIFPVPESYRCTQACESYGIASDIISNTLCDVVLKTQFETIDKEVNIQLLKLGAVCQRQDEMAVQLSTICNEKILNLKLKKRLLYTECSAPRELRVLEMKSPSNEIKRVDKTENW